MSTKTSWTTPWQTRSAYRPAPASGSGDSSRITAEALRTVREPLRWCLDLGTRAPPDTVMPILRAAALGPCDRDWSPPSWLLPHQLTAARCLILRLACYGGALLADAVGLGKTYVALAVVTRYRRAVALVPAALSPQWRRVAAALGVRVAVESHEALSRGASVPPAELVVVDEAHRFRNPSTRRYDRLARAAPHGHLLLLSATPVVNRPADLVNLLRLFLPDHGLAVHGLPSLGSALAPRRAEPLAHATAGLVVARSPEAVRAELPAVLEVRDAEVVSAPPLNGGLLERIAEGIGRLAFPGFGDRQAAELLRLHLWYRLASSAPAFRETLRRHTAYLDRAIAAAARGEPLSRHASRALFGPDEAFQLELDVWEPGPVRLDARCLVAEREQVQQLWTAVAPAQLPDPKAFALESILARRPGGKTLVFTSAIATATYLARRLRWRRLCVATARGARIASGPIGLEQALELFAPHARHATQPPVTLALDTLIATDLLSEGLDLQDADAVVHYDLPWTPLRLAQRLGRVARLGSRHERVWVWWFAPCAPIEARLALAARLRIKLGGQLRLGVPASGGVGKARVVGGLFDWRQHFGGGGRPGAGAPCFAVVRGPRFGLFALRWIIGAQAIPELVLVAGQPPAVVRSERGLASMVERISRAPASAAPPPAEILDTLHAAVRARLVDRLRGPADDDTRRLMRQVFRVAARAAQARDARRLRWLNAALDGLVAGVPVGSLRDLEEILSAGPRMAGPVHHRAAQDRGTRQAYAAVALEAALLGDGTLTEA